MISYIATTNAVKPESPGKPVIRIVARNIAFVLGGQSLIKIFASFSGSMWCAGWAVLTSGAMRLPWLVWPSSPMFTDLGTSSLSVREMVRKREKIAWMVPDIVALRAVLSLGAIIGTTLSAWLLGKAPDMVLGIFIANCGLLLCWSAIHLTQNPPPTPSGARRRPVIVTHNPISVRECRSLC